MHKRARPSVQHYDQALACIDKVRYRVLQGVDDGVGGHLPSPNHRATSKCAPKLASVQLFNVSLGEETCCADAVAPLRCCAVAVAPLRPCSVALAPLRPSPLRCCAVAPLRCAVAAPLRPCALKRVFGL